MSEIPKKVTADQYDKLMRKLWETEQRLIVVEKTIVVETAADELYRKMQRLEKMITKIGVRIFKKGIKNAD